MHISLATRRHTVVGIIEGASQDHCQTAAMHAQCPPWVNRYRSLRTENRSMSAVARKRRKVRALACVAKGHGGGCREPLQRSVMMVARFYRSITPTAPAFERSIPAITLDVHLQDRGVKDAAIDGRERHGLVGENLAPFAEGLVGRDQQGSTFISCIFRYPRSGSYWRNET